MRFTLLLFFVLASVQLSWAKRTAVQMSCIAMDHPPDCNGVVRIGKKVVRRFQSPLSAVWPTGTAQVCAVAGLPTLADLAAAVVDLDQPVPDPYALCIDGNNGLGHCEFTSVSLRGLESGRPRKRTMRTIVQLPSSGKRVHVVLICRPPPKD